jgi:ribosomal protein S18 acetylase RimI-like enzyme
VIVERPTITDAVGSEAGEVVTLQRAAFLRDAQLYNDPFMPSLTQSVDEIRAEIGDPDIVFLLARLGPRLVGSVRARKLDDRWYVWRLMSAPDLEGRGIGRLLMDELEQRANGVVGLFELSTGSKSASNIAWYERLGYEIVDEHEASPTLQVVTMRKPLTRRI